jgi:hypothetical protein
MHWISRFFCLIILTVVSASAQAQTAQIPSTADLANFYVRQIPTLLPMSNGTNERQKRDQLALQIYKATINLSYSYPALRTININIYNSYITSTVFSFNVPTITRNTALPLATQLSVGINKIMQDYVDAQSTAASQATNNEGIGAKGNVFVISTEGKPQVRISTGMVDFAGAINVNGSIKATKVDFQNLRVAEGAYFDRGISATGKSEFSGEVAIYGQVLASAGLNVRNGLLVEGEVKISNSGLPCNNDTEGAMRYVKEQKEFQGCNGQSWVTLNPAISNGNSGGGN